MFTFEPSLTEHSPNTQLLSSIVEANYRGVRQTGRIQEKEEGGEGGSGGSNTMPEMLVCHMGQSSSMESSKFI